MSLLLWTHSHSTGWFQIHIIKHFVTQKFRAVAQLTVLTSVQPVLQYSNIYVLNIELVQSLLKASVKKMSFNTEH